MNYFAHAYRYLHDPYFVAGVAIPDWLSVVDRRIRCRSKHAKPFVDAADVAIRQIARGVVQHHRDDSAFHQSRAFAELSLQLAQLIRRRMQDDTPMRPGFLGHILVEILLDADLIADNPGAIDNYYMCIDSIDRRVVDAALRQLTDRGDVSITQWIGRFLHERFLLDYADDAKLTYRLNQVMRRVKLPPLPDRFAEILPQARRMVRQRHDDLLAAVFETTP